MLRPLIGVTANVIRATWGDGEWNNRLAVSAWSVVQQVVAAGGRPVLLPPAGGEEAGLVSRLDGVVFSGGADVAPELYGQRPGPHTVVSEHPGHDAAEIALHNAAAKAGIPVLAICRGHQLVNVARGGELIQHIDDPASRHTATGGFAPHRVRLEPGTRLASILGSETKAHCHHHQAVGRTGHDLVAVAWSEDGLVEACELPDHRFFISVQWHPESGEITALFDAFVHAAGEYATASHS